VGSPKLGHTSSRGEDETLERIRQALGGGIEAFGLRDDAGQLEVPPGGSLVVSVDSVVDGVHFDLALCDLSDVGWKALMGALSDLAAMGARPVGALVALCVPEGAGDGATAVQVMEGVAAASRAAGCPIVGGDLSSSGELVVSVTVLGDADGAPVRRSGARDGDVIVVTGACGGSAAGLRVLRGAAGRGRGGGGGGSVGVGVGVGGEQAGALGEAYRRPVARLDEGVAARLAGASAMIDVSDGLALDLHRLADASGVGFELTEIPVAIGATMEEALGGGEDYELLITLESGRVEGFLERFLRSAFRPPIPIGAVTKNATIRTLNGAELSRNGWQHRIG
jgi:thiamine-monophosphate kinase